MGKTYSRKATFKVNKGKNGEREFAPVNERAKRVVCNVLGLSRNKRKNYPSLSVAELRSTKGKGSYRFYAYDSENNLKAIRV